MRLISFFLCLVIVIVSSTVLGRQTMASQKTPSQTACRWGPRGGAERTRGRRKVWGSLQWRSRHRKRSKRMRFQRRRAEEERRRKGVCTILCWLLLLLSFTFCFILPDFLSESISGWIRLISFFLCLVIVIVSSTVLGRQTMASQKRTRRRRPRGRLWILPALLLLLSFLLPVSHFKFSVSLPSNPIPILCRVIFWLFSSRSLFLASPRLMHLFLVLAFLHTTQAMDPSGGSSNPSGDSSQLHVILATGVACIKAAVENRKRKLEDNNTSSQNKKKVRVFEERSNKLNWRVYRILTHTLF